MKKLTILILSIFIFTSIISVAQNSVGKADDGARISLSPQVSDKEMPQEAKKQLLNKISQICVKNGISNDGENPFFVLEATIDVLSKDIASTIPPMHALVLQVNFFIKDVVNNNIYSETSLEIKGIGTNETKAYISGLKNINTSEGKLKAFVDRGKVKILEFYNSECDFIISKAKSLEKQGNSVEAIKVLKSVPKVSLACYDKCMEILGEIERPVEEKSKTADTETSNVKPVNTVSNEPETDADEAKIIEDDNIETAKVEKDVSAVSVPKKPLAIKPVSVASSVALNAKVLVEVSRKEFQYREYKYGTVNKITSLETNDEYEVLPQSGGKKLWTRDIITRWHKADRTELTEGTLVLYKDNEGATTYYPGYVVKGEASDNDQVSVKGRKNAVRDINISLVIIPDSEVLK